MKFIAMLCLLGICNYAQATGCGSYDYFRHIQKVKPVKTLVQHEVVSMDDTFVRIRLPDASEVTLVLEQVGKSPNPKTGLTTSDVEFEEGNGCGPIYICVTGRYQISMTDSAGSLRTYSWPSVTEYTSHSQEGWVAGSLLPTFTGLLPVGDKSDLNQCVYGNW